MSQVLQHLLLSLFLSKNTHGSFKIKDLIPKTRKDSIHDCFQSVKISRKIISHGIFQKLEELVFDCSPCGCAVLLRKGSNAVYIETKLCIS